MGGIGSRQRQFRQVSWLLRKKLVGIRGSGSSLLENQLCLREGEGEVQGQAGEGRWSYATGPMADLVVCTSFDRELLLIFCK